MELRILPGNIANMIAAGEVVQRPASAIKELMENSVDAGATQISVIITDAGRTLMQVIDDGCGMTPDDAVLCFERHATSKIATAEDLDSITTFGFRGEALASIAAVAEVTLRTRRPEDEIGVEVTFAASEHTGTRETAAPSGTSISVRNLFYNVPARRKFLKSDNVEFRHIVEEFTRVALTRPDISFSLSHNGKDIYVLRPAKSLKFRILDLLGSNVVGDIVDIHTDTSVVSINGYVGRPDKARKTLGNQFLFVNGRYFRSPYMHKAVMKAYEDIIPDGVTPSYFIYMDVDPHSIDVNIHPTKTEIKFEDDSVIFQILYACVRESIGRFALADRLDFDNPEVKELPTLGKKFDEYIPDTVPTTADPEFNPFDFSAGTSSSTESHTPGHSPVILDRQVEYPSHDVSPSPDYSRFIDRRDDYGRLFEDKTLPSAQVMVLQSRYIIAQSRSGLMLINIRRAHERILFDRFLRALSKNTHISQTTLFPEQIEVGASNRLIFEEHNGLLTSLGFDIAPFGNDTIVVNAVPEGFSAEGGKVRTLISDILLILSEDHTSLPGMIEASMAEKFAFLGASGATCINNTIDAQRLMDTLMSSSNPEYTNSGKKIITILPIEEIDKKF